MTIVGRAAPVLAGAVAAVLDLPRAAFVLDDDGARQEADAYETIAGLLWSGAAQLEAAGERIVAARDLPMGAHDRSVLSSPLGGEVFAFVRGEREIADLLWNRLPDEEAMLTDMSGG